MEKVPANGSETEKQQEAQMQKMLLSLVFCPV